MSSGNVRWFNESKGFGFITPTDGSDEIFVHFSAINGSGLATLNEHQSVIVEVENSPKGPRATRIMVQD